MPTYQANIIRSEEGGAVQIFEPGEYTPLTANDGHPAWHQILTAIADGAEYEALVALFNPAQAISDRFESIGHRVSVRGDTLYFDGDAVHSALTDHILRLLNEGDEDWAETYVAFYEKLMNNPSENSREQLYRWLGSHDFTLVKYSGDIVAYKGCALNDEGAAISIHSGHAIVDGEERHGRIPYPIGSFVEMPRSEVADDPHTSCSYGLHFGTRAYAQGYADGVMLEVHVDPRDVVSVPAGEDQKARCCRMYVAEVNETEHTAPSRDFGYTASFGWSDGEEYDEEFDDDEEVYLVGLTYADLEAYPPVAAQMTIDDALDPEFLAAEEIDFQALTPEEAAEPDNHPTEDEFTVMIQRAARRHRPFVKYAIKHGPWKFVGSQRQVLDNNALDRTQWEYDAEAEDALNARGEF
jgi:hypothetical protein